MGPPPPPLSSERGLGQRGRGAWFLQGVLSVPLGKEPPSQLGPAFAKPAPHLAATDTPRHTRFGPMASCHPGVRIGA